MNKAIINGETLDVVEFEDALPSEGPNIPFRNTFYALLSEHKLYRVIAGEGIPPHIEYTYVEVGDYIDEDNITLDTDTLLIKVPEKYKTLYQRILHLLVEYGEEMLKDCKSSCKDRNINIIDCYNMFLSLLAANHEGLTKLEDVLKEHIEYKLNFYYGDNVVDEDVKDDDEDDDDDDDELLPIDDGK